MTRTHRDARRPRPASGRGDILREADFTFELRERHLCVDKVVMKVPRRRRRDETSRNQSLHGNAQRFRHLRRPRGRRRQPLRAIVIYAIGGAPTQSAHCPLDAGPTRRGTTTRRHCAARSGLHQCAGDRQQTSANNAHGWCASESTDCHQAGRAKRRTCKEIHIFTQHTRSKYPHASQVAQRSG